MADYDARPEAREEALRLLIEGALTDLAAIQSTDPDAQHEIDAVHEKLSQGLDEVDVSERALELIARANCGPLPNLDKPFAEAVEPLESGIRVAYLRGLLERHATVSDAARAAGIDRANFRRMLRRYGLTTPAMRPEPTPPASPTP